MLKSIVARIHEEVDTAFDAKVYTKNRLMKCIKQAKLDGRVQERIEGKGIESHLISCFIDKSKTIPFPVLHAKLSQRILCAKHEPINLGKLPRMKLETPDDVEYDAMTAEQAFAMLPINQKFSHEYTHIVVMEMR